MSALRTIRPKDPDDGTKWCNSCRAHKEGPCVFHTEAIADEPILPHAYATLPKQLEIDCKPYMKQKGVFTKIEIFAPTVFGPLVGVLSEDGGPVIRYPVKMPDRSQKYYRLESDHRCNWMKFVRAADKPDEANVLAFQQNSQIYFVSIRPLALGEELRVGYMAFYGASLLKLQKRNQLQYAGHQSGLDSQNKLNEFEEDTVAAVNDASLPALDDDNSYSVSPVASGPADSETAFAGGLPGPNPVVPVAEPAPKPRTSGTANLNFRKAVASTSSGKTRKRAPSVFDESSLDVQGRDRLQAIVDVNPYQFAKRSPEYMKAWGAVYSSMVKLGYSMTRQGRHAVQAYLSRRLDAYQKLLDKAATPDEVARLKRKNPLVDRVQEQKNGQPRVLEQKNRQPRPDKAARPKPLTYGADLPESYEHEVSSTSVTADMPDSDISDGIDLFLPSGLPDMPVRTALPQLHSSEPQEPPKKRIRLDRDTAGASGSDRAIRLRKRRQVIRASLDQADPVEPSVKNKDLMKKVRQERLEAVVEVNPYQFPVGKSTAAWNAVCDRLLGLGHPSGSTVRSTLHVFVSRHVEQYQKSLNAAVTPEEIARLKEENVLLERLTEMRRQQPKVADVDEPDKKGKASLDPEYLKTHAMERLHAIVQANPFQYPLQTRELRDCWHDIYGSLLSTGLVEDEAPEIGVAKLKLFFKSHMEALKRKMDDGASKGEDFVPSTPIELLAQQLLLLRQSRPKFSEADRLARKTNPQKWPRPKLKSTCPSEKAGYRSIFWKFRCDTCACEFRNRDIYHLHGVKHGKIADTSALSTTCPACGVEHASLDELMIHIERHERRPSIYKKITDFRCQTCLRYFSSQLFLDRHIRRMHTEIGSERDFECKTCAKKYITLAALKSHERVHTARKFFECPVCLLGTPDAGQMQEHTESHRANGVFACRVCTKAFPEFHMLRRHLRQQHENKRFTCAVCQKVCLREAALKRHMLVHEANFGFQCETCGRKFKRNENYTDHMRRLHNPDRVYKLKERSEKVAKAFASAKVCEFCTRQYANEERLLIHQRAKHLEKMPLERRFPKVDEGVEDEGDSGSSESVYSESDD